MKQNLSYISLETARNKKIEKKSSKLSWLAYILIFLSPFEVYQVLLPGDIHLTAYMAFVLLLLPLFVIQWLTRTISLKYSHISFLFLCYIFSGICSLLFANNMLAATRGLGGSVILFMSFLYVTCYLNSRKEIENAMTVFIFTGLIVAIMVLCQFFGYIFFQQRILPPFVESVRGIDLATRSGYGFMGGLMRPYGFFASLNRVGSYLLIPFGMSLYRSFYGTKFRQFYFGIAGFLFISIMCSLSRNAWLSFVIFATIVFIFHNPKIFETIFRLYFLLIVIGVILVFFYFHQRTGFDPIDHINVFNPTGSANVMSVFCNHLWAAINAIIETFGVGMGIQNFDNWAYQQDYVQLWGSHSNFIIFLGETGIMGFMSQLFIVLYVFRYGIKICTHKPIDKQSVYLIAIYFGLVEAGVIRTFYFASYTFLLLGLLIRNSQICSKTPPVCNHNPYRDMPLRVISKYTISHKNTIYETEFEEIN